MELRQDMFYSQELDMASPSLNSDVLWFEGDEDTDFVVDSNFSMALGHPPPAKIRLIGVLTKVMATVDAAQTPWTTLHGVIVRPDDDDVTLFGMSSLTPSALQYWELVLSNIDRLLQWHLGYVPPHSLFSGLIQHGGVHVA